MKSLRWGQAERSKDCIFSNLVSRLGRNSERMTRRWVRLNESTRLKALQTVRKDLESSESLLRKVWIFMRISSVKIEMMLQLESIKLLGSFWDLEKLSGYKEKK